MIKYIKKGDRKPFPRVVLSYVSDGVAQAVDLTGSTIKFIMRRSGEATATINNTLAGSELVDLENGQVQYEWRVGDTDETGNYLAEFEVTDVASKKLTFWDLRTPRQISQSKNPEPLIIAIVDDLE